MGGIETVNETTNEAEWAQRRLVARVLEFRSVVEAATVRPGRHLLADRRTRFANAIVDYVAIAESFIVSALLALHDVDEPAVGSWKSREKLWAEHHPMHLNEFAEWDKLLGYVEFRNAVQHGLGSLTERQLGRHKAEVLRQIDAAGIERSGGSLFVTREHVENCERTCRNFIDWVGLESKRFSARGAS